MRVAVLADINSMEVSPYRGRRTVAISAHASGVVPGNTWCADSRALGCSRWIPGVASAQLWRRVDAPVR
jgi:hypothetical protein